MDNDQAILIARARLMLRSGKATELRVRHHLSIGDAARSIGVTTSTLSRWERGLRTPRGPGAQRLAILLRRLSELDTI